MYMWTQHIALFEDTGFAKIFPSLYSTLFNKILTVAEVKGNDIYTIQEYNLSNIYSLNVISWELTMVCLQAVNDEFQNEKFRNNQSDIVIQYVSQNSL